MEGHFKLHFSPFKLGYLTACTVYISFLIVKKDSKKLKIPHADELIVPGLDEIAKNIFQNYFRSIPNGRQLFSDAKRHLKNKFKIIVLDVIIQFYFLERIYSNLYLINRVEDILGFLGWKLTNFQWKWWTYQTKLISDKIPF